MRLGDYDILGPLGMGGFGRVWLARAPSRGSAAPPVLVAIKRLRDIRVGPNAEPEKASRCLEAFKYEAHIGSYLNHPNVVRLIELTELEGRYALVMEYVDGIGVDELIDQRRRNQLPLPPHIALEIAIQAGDGLDYAHEARGPDGKPLEIIHRDVKPSNIMVSRDGLVRVMDFGVARSALPRTQTTTGTIKGTLRYLSPEQAQGARDIGPAADQFALALVLGEMLIGRPIYDEEKDHRVLLMALTGAVGSKLSEAEQACPGVGSVLARALSAKPEARYPSVGALVNALRRLNPPMNPRYSLEQWVHLGLEERVLIEEEDTRWLAQLHAGGGVEQIPAPAHTSDIRRLCGCNALLSGGHSARDLNVLRQQTQDRLRIRDASSPWELAPSESDVVDRALLQAMASRDRPEPEPRPVPQREGSGIHPLSATEYRFHRGSTGALRIRLGERGAVAPGAPAELRAKCPTDELVLGARHVQEGGHPSGGAPSTASSNIFPASTGATMGVDGSRVAGPGVHGSRGVSWGERADCAPRESAPVGRANWVRGFFQRLLGHEPKPS